MDEYGYKKNVSTFHKSDIVYRILLRGLHILQIVMLCSQWDWKEFNARFSKSNVNIESRGFVCFVLFVVFGSGGVWVGKIVFPTIDSFAFIILRKNRDRPAMIKWKQKHYFFKFLFLKGNNTGRLIFANHKRISNSLYRIIPIQFCNVWIRS